MSDNNESTDLGENSKKRIRSPNSQSGESPENKQSKCDPEGRADNTFGDLTDGECTITEQKKHITICDPVLAYVVFAMNSGTQEAIKNAVLGHFTSVQILTAKNALWTNVDNETIGKLINRKTTQTRKVEEANVADILCAIAKLDKADVMPNVVISATDLGLIPRAHPEELNNISLCDRLVKIEHRINEMQGRILRNSTEIHDITSKRKQENAEDPVPSQLQQVEIDIPDPPVPSDSEQTPLTFNLVYQQSTPKCGFGRGRGQASGRGRGSYASVTSNLLAPKEVLRLRGSNTSLCSKGSGSNVESDGFQLSKHELKKKRDKENRRRNVIVGTGSAISGVKGAPEASRDIFIFRLHETTTHEALETFIKKKGCEVRNLARVSNDNAKYKSFRLTVPKSQFAKLLSDTEWPEGVSVRKYFPPKKNREDSIYQESKWG